jgi:hypothetical protein
VKVYKLCAVDGGPGFILPEFLIVFGFLLARRSAKKLVSIPKSAFIMQDTGEELDCDIYVARMTVC